MTLLSNPYRSPLAREIEVPAVTNPWGSATDPVGFRREAAGATSRTAIRMLVIEPERSLRSVSNVIVPLVPSGSPRGLWEG
jgi:hypothetical protein